MSCCKDQLQVDGGLRKDDNYSIVRHSFLNNMPFVIRNVRCVNNSVRKDALERITLVPLIRSIVSHLT
jgi:hypothetical protein